MDTLSEPLQQFYTQSWFMDGSGMSRVIATLEDFFNDYKAWIAKGAYYKLLVSLARSRARLTRHRAALPRSAGPHDAEGAVRRAHQPPAGRQAAHQPQGLYAPGALNAPRAEWR